MGIILAAPMRIMGGTLIGLIAAATAAPAWAQGEYEGATQCRGNLVRQSFIEESGQRIARLEMFYAPAENLFCARLVHVGPTYDVQLLTQVELYKSASRSGPETLVRRDRGDYYRYAGPIGARGDCMSAGGFLSWRNKGYSIKFADKVCR
jgi:hypothetical protein